MLKIPKKRLTEIIRIQCSLRYTVCIINQYTHALHTYIYLDLVHCCIIFALFCQEIYTMTLLQAFLNVVLTLNNRKCVSDYKLLFSYGNLTEHFCCGIFVMNYILICYKALRVKKNVLIILCIKSTISSRITPADYHQSLT